MQAWIKEDEEEASTVITIALHCKCGSGHYTKESETEEVSEESEDEEESQDEEELEEHGICNLSANMEETMKMSTSSSLPNSEWQWLEFHIGTTTRPTWY